MPVLLSSSDAVRFGVFEADLRSGELRKCGVKIKIQELPFQALRLLLSRPNEVLSREEIRRSLWPDGTFVDFDRGIISAINFKLDIQVIDDPEGGKRAVITLNGKYLPTKPF